MPKVNASLADISTEYKFIEPDDYILEVKEVDLREDKAKNKDGQEIVRVTHIIKSVVVSKLDGEETEDSKKPVYDYINIHTKEGELNEISLANLKRYFEACAPDMAESEDADTDALVGQRFQAQVYIDSYTPQGASEPRQSNKIKPSTILPLQ